MTTRFSLKLAAFLAVCAVFVGAVLTTHRIETKLQSRPIDINTATAEELQRLDGMTYPTASYIVAYRDQVILFTSVEELLYVDGITRKDLDRWRPHIAL